ncbi:hypothetical protein BGW38_003370 [Lunasporangiospora selenospora]|uniref:PH domain-containing protein n=1 Tax=Lunasporangiospora selenospora TaxID=979761 RepID=A0A9P6FRI9_9FUNG|nr:hypothetical protein BGW38_003370 [Lunasporangiospora selenospora]
MLLHTDAHNKNVRHKMSKEQYVKQAKSIEGVNTVPADILEVLYDNIIYLKFVYAEDEMDVDGQRMAEVQPPSGLWFNRRRAASNQRMHVSKTLTPLLFAALKGSIAHLAPDLSDLIPFRWPYYWKGTIEMVDNVQINNQFTKAPVASIPGLRSRRYSHSQDFGVSGTQPRSPGQQYPSETMEKYDSDLREILADREMDEQWNTKQDWGVKTACPSEGSAELKIVKYGILSRKIDLENGRKSTVRGWRELGVILSGSQLLFFTDVSWFHQQRNIHVGFNPEAPPEEDGYFSTVISSGMPPIPQALISTLDSIAIVDSSYQKYRHVFRLACPNGKQYLFRAESEHQMNDWMAKINYASAFKTVGVRLRSYRVSWASDVMWVKDEQGRHQLRRRHRSNQDQQKEPLDARARLIVAKIRDIDRQINICSASLAAELRLARGLEVMIPLQNTTRQKIVQSATVVGKKLRHLMLERTKLDCFRTILERDMAVVPAPMLGSNPCCHHGMGLGVHIDGSMSGTAPCGHPSCISEGSSGYAASLDHSVTPITPSNASFSPDRDIGKATTSFSNISSVTSQWSEKEEILESNNGMGGEESSGKAKPKLKLPEFHRSVSENALDEQSTARSRRTTDIPLGPLAIQAAIIDAARGNVVGVSSTMSSPDPSQYQDTQGSPVHHSQRAQTAASSPLHNQSLLTPESPTSQVAARSRALSMPGQRPSRMPRTVSIYSSSSQTASRLKRIIEQGLGHFKWKASSSTSSPVTSPSSPLSSGPSVLAPSALDYESATDDPTVASCNSASSRIVDTVPIISDDSGKTGSSLDVGLQVPYGILATGKPKAAIIPLVQEPTGMDTLDTTENQAYNKHRSGIDGKLRRQSVMEAFIGYGAADRRMDSETLLDDSEDEVIIDNPRPPPQHDSTASSGTLLEHSYVMMAKEDYTPDLHSLSDAEIEPSNSIIEHHDKESHLNLSQDTPSLSLTVDSDESWQKIP